MEKSIIGDYYNIQTLVDMDNFIELLFASIANISLIYDFDNVNSHESIYVPINYKEIIKDIMYNEDTPILNLSKIIEIEKYYFDQEEWEKEFDCSVEKYLTKTDKIKTYSQNNNSIEIKFNSNEIKQILLKYDADIVDVTSYFAYMILTTTPKEKVDKQPIKKTILKEYKVSFQG